MRLRHGMMVSTLGVGFLVASLAATAFACTSLATIDTPTSAALPGTNVAVTGASFSAKAGTPVIFHWNGASGPEVARVMPDANGTVKANFTVPKADPGYYVLIATQVDASGKAVYGTPARASFQVLGPDGRAPASPAAPPQQPGRPVSAPDSSGLLALTFALGGLGLLLFGAGFVTMIRQSRRRAQPAATPVRHY